MVIDFPSGRQVEVAMHDDGLHADVASNDGVFGGVIEVRIGPAQHATAFQLTLSTRLQALEPGQYLARAVFEGVTSAGVHFVRTTEHSFHVVKPYVSLTGTS